MSISVPTKEFSKDEEWLLLSKVLGKRIIFRADVINIKNKHVVDFDDHHCNEATAITSVKCKGRNIFITNKIFKN